MTPLRPAALRRLLLHIAFILGISGGTHPLAAQDQKGFSLDSLLGVRVSSASKHLQAVRDAPASVTIITADEITQYGWSDLSQLLNAVRGFYVSYDRNYTYVGVRGFGRPTDYNNRLLLLINGHTINEGIWGSTAIGRDLGIDLRSLERVEVIRGPGSSLYGQSAVFAVINLITKEGDAVDGAHLYGTLGSYGQRELSVISGKEFAQGIDVVANALWGRTDGQTLFFPELASDSATGGTIRGLDWEERRGGFIGISHPQSGFSFQSRYVWRKKGMPTGSFGQIPGRRPAFTNDEMLFAELKWARDLSPALQVNARAFIDQYWYNGTYQFEPIFKEEAVAHSWGGEGSLQLDLGSHNRAILGTEYRDYTSADYRTVTAPVVRFHTPYSVISAFAQDEVDLARWLTLVGGVRYDHIGEVGGHLSPRAAAVIRPDRLTAIKLVYGNAFRAPSVAERNYRPTGGKLNDDLQPEVVTSYDVSIQRQVSRGTLVTIGAFNNRIKHLIELVIDPTDSLLVNRNVSEAEATGAYAELEWQHERGMHLGLSASLTEADDEEQESHLTNSPRLLVKGSASAPLPAGLVLGVVGRYESERQTVFSEETPSFVVVDANLHWQPRGRWDRVEAGLRVNNIFDKRYANPGGLQHPQSMIWQDGRNLQVTAGLRF